ncbi:GDYXXLXY domain-containing protein [Aquibacillus rhizosphaerae]|uniref:GDYXXLXY domain-containing protein n=1 Tax=Aquibacillus rhizosphaerae TaxID=3051431 RepID=A0ABT7LAI3_9BACI|nr:GDYXXLXY domain-containing protein [Aquibacillus sp. LR5S19]MDL4842874.1 GDYXXLXY domain-containing protein [Aquibacillus sp. LR5S19]
MKRILFYLTIGLQCLFLIGLAVSFYLIDYFGETIKLETLPVDPQDIFYGDYVTLRYQIEEIPDAKWDAEKDPEYGETIYVLLEKGTESNYQVAKASSEKMGTTNEQVIMKAKVDYYDSTTKVHYVDYGLGRYYIEDNTGGKFEQSGQMSVTVAIAPWGQKKIVGIE